MHAIFSACWVTLGVFSPERTTSGVGGCGGKGKGGGGVLRWVEQLGTQCAKGIGPTSAAVGTRTDVRRGTAAGDVGPMTLYALGRYTEDYERRETIHGHTKILLLAHV